MSKGAKNHRKRAGNRERSIEQRSHLAATDRETAQLVARATGHHLSQQRYELDTLCARLHRDVRRYNYVIEEGYA
jgi:hypothetical protein